MANTKKRDISKERDEAIAEAEAILREAEEMEAQENARILQQIYDQRKERAIEQLLKYFESCDNGDDSFTKYERSQYYCRPEGFRIDDVFYDKFRRRYRAYQRDEITRRQLLKEAFNGFVEPSTLIATQTIASTPIATKTAKDDRRFFLKAKNVDLSRIYKELVSQRFIAENESGFINAFNSNQEAPQGQIKWIKTKTANNTPYVIPILEFVGLMADDMTIPILDNINAIFGMNIGRSNKTRHNKHFDKNPKGKPTKLYATLRKIVRGK